MEDQQVAFLDLAVILIYMVAIVTAGLLSSMRKRKMSSDDYFLAGRGLNWAMVGAALFASNISTVHLVGLAASGFQEGLVWGNFEWMAAFTLILLGLIFAPFYFKSRISTLPEFLEKRFSPASRTFLAFMAIVGALFVHIGMSLYAGAVIFQTFFGMNVILSIILISVLTAIYTVAGGLKAVVVTETIQTVILIVGAAGLTLFAIFALPGVGVESLADLKAAVRPNQLSMLRSDGGGDAGLSWYAVFLGYPVLGIWYWCSDQTIVQRVLGAKTQYDAQAGPIFAGFIKILPVFVMVLPGVLAYVLFGDHITDANQALPVLIMELLPTGIKGLMAAALLAALMSTIAAALNSSSTLVAVDIVKRIWPDTGDRSIVRTGRIAAVVVMMMAILWSTQGDQFSSIFEAINRIAAALAPPISAVFLLGVFSKRGTQQAALTTLIVGFIAGAVFFSLDFVPQLSDQPMLITDTLGIPFMMQAWWLFCFCCVLFLLVSRFTPQPSERQLQYTWDNPLAVISSGRIEGVKDVRVLAGVLLITMVVLYVIFA